MAQDDTLSGPHRPLDESLAPLVITRVVGQSLSSPVPIIDTAPAVYGNSTLASLVSRQAVLQNNITSPLAPSLVTNQSLPEPSLAAVPAAVEITPVVTTHIVMDTAVQVGQAATFSTKPPESTGFGTTPSGPATDLHVEEKKAFEAEKEMRRVEEDRKMNPWKYDQCFSAKDACRNTLWQGEHEPTLEAKACWVHQDNGLFASKSASVFCREPLLKCNCTNAQFYCAEFFKFIKCNSDKDLGGACTSYTANALTHYIQNVLPMVANYEEEKMGNPKLRMDLTALYWGNYTGHVMPEFVASRFCEADSGLMTEIGSAGNSGPGNKPPDKCAPKRVKGDLGPELGSGWKLVRRVAPGTTWHPATDNLAGSDVYGKSSEDKVSPETFSVSFEAEDFNQFLFATGDMTKWMIVPRKQVFRNGNPFEGEVLKSSRQKSVHAVRWINRGDVASDPFLSLTSADKAARAGDVLYAEANLGGEAATTILPTHKGANVFIRMYVPKTLEELQNEADCKAKGSGTTSVTSKFPDYVDQYSIGSSGKSTFTDLRPCLNDSCDDFRFLKPDKFKPVILKPTVSQATQNVKTGCDGGGGAVDPDAQFDEPEDGVVCERGKDQEGPCSRKKTPCRRYTDRLPFYQPKSGSPCRQKAALRFLKVREPSKDAPDTLVVKHWNEEMEYQNFEYPPPMDPYVDPEQWYINNAEKERRQKPIGGDSDVADILNAAYPRGVESDDIPAKVRPVDQETKRSAFKKRELERLRGRPQDREFDRQERARKDREEAKAQALEDRIERNQFFARLAASYRRRAQEAKRNSKLPSG